MDVYNTLLLLGILQGIIIGVYFLLSNKKMSTTYKLLCFFIITLSLALFEPWIIAIGFISMNTNAKFGIPFHLLTLPAFYLYIKHYIHILLVKKVHYFVLLSPFIISFFLKITYQFLILFDVSSFSVTSLRYYLKETHKLFIIIAAGYLVELIINLIQYQKKTSYASKETKRKIKWIFYFFSMLLVIMILWCLITFIFTKTYQLRYLALFATTFVIYWVSFTGIYELKIETKKGNLTRTDLKKLKVSDRTIKKENIEKILIGLQELEEEKYFLESECSISSIAKKLKSNTTYVSKVVKLHYQKNFNQYINDLRIEYVITRLMSDRKLRKYSVSSISKEIGYKSPDTFTKHFRQHTGILPSRYIKNLSKI